MVTDPKDDNRYKKHTHFVMKLIYLLLSYPETKNQKSNKSTLKGIK